jgi:hypothetical protein
VDGSPDDRLRIACETSNGVRGRACVGCTARTDQTVQGRGEFREDLRGSIRVAAYTGQEGVPGEAACLPQFTFSPLAVEPRKDIPGRS